MSVTMEQQEIRQKLYGQRYWCVKVATEVSSSGEIYLLGDRVELQDGALIILSPDRGDGYRLTNLVLAPGQWRAVYAASHLDGAAVAVEHWDGELAEPCH